jgi:type IV pilus assembly protein PilX
MNKYSRIESSTSPHGRDRQKGVVLIIALIMLVVISMLAVFSVRNATSNEAVSGNVRTTQLATQAAEFALRYCENDLVQTTPTLTVTFSTTDFPHALHKDNSGNLNYWDTSTSLPAGFNAVVVVPTTSIGGTTTFKRPPECMIEPMQVLNSSGVPTHTSTFLITARGFGPEVSEAGSTRDRPSGSEVWLQSTIELK